MDHPTHVKAMEQQKPTTIIPHVQGNELRLAIPLQLETVALEEGEAKVTYSEFIPHADYPVKVVLANGTATKELEAVMQENVAIAIEPGTITEGRYSVTVLCRDQQAKKRRFKQRSVVQVFDVTSDAGLPEGIEFNSETHILDAAVFLAVSGLDGRGIDHHEVEESQESGGVNTITFYYTDGTTAVLRVRNGVDGNAVLRHVPIEPEDFEVMREAGELSENSIYLVFEEE